MWEPYVIVRQTGQTDQQTTDRTTEKTSTGSFLSKSGTWLKGDYDVVGCSPSSYQRKSRQQTMMKDFCNKRVRVPQRRYWVKLLAPS